MSLQALPLEILETILSFVVHPKHPNSRPFFYQYRDSLLQGKHDILQCAIVCKTWLIVARRRLCSTYFSEGKVKIYPALSELSQLVEIFGSPLCTFQPCFLKALFIRPASVSILPGQPDTREEFFLDKLSVLCPLASLSSLHTLIFNNIILSTHSNDDYPHRDHFDPKYGRKIKIDPWKPPSTTIVSSRIKHLEFYNYPGTSFEDVLCIIRLFPSIESFNTQGMGYELVYHDLYPSVNPPKTLRKLDLDICTFPHVIRWLGRCEPPHTKITSMSINSGSEYVFNGGNIFGFFNRIGNNLEELELTFDFWDMIWEDKTVPINPFLKNSSLRKLVINAPEFDVLCELLPDLFRPDDFGPNLEMLKIIIQDCELDKRLYLLTKLVDFDFYLYSRPSIRQVIVTPPQECYISHDVWNDLKKGMRECLPWTQSQGKLKFKDIVIELA